NAALQVTHPKIANAANQAVTDLENTAITIAQDSSSSDAQTLLTSAITTFDNAMLDTTGLFGPKGPIAHAAARGEISGPTPISSQAATTLQNVSGTATGGTATLTATLTSGSSSSSTSGVSGKIISFILDGAFAGLAVTDSNGVATLTGVPTTDSTG